MRDARRGRVRGGGRAPPPHRRGGEGLRGADPGHALEEDAVIEFCADHLARYKCPQKVNFVDALPQNLSGKVLRRALR
jgi:acyl-CoA synthetase (AMP-forming)/AMP-acid ligase II